MASEFGVALAQLNLVVGDLQGNRDRVIAAAIDARDRLNCRYAVFPELTVCGYPPEDLLLRNRFIDDCEATLQTLTDAVPGIALCVGHPHRESGALFNAATMIDDGRQLCTYHKQLLPNYGVFDEKRYFSAGIAPKVQEIDGVRIGLTICEDVWEVGPVEQSVAQGADLIFTLNGSPFDAAKIAYRENEIVRTRARNNNVSIVYVNLVGGQDELVFDGGSLVCDASGSVVVRAAHFEEAVVRSTFTARGPITPIAHTVAPIPDNVQGVYTAIRLGVADYIGKNGFKGAVLGLSGGIDSALTLCIVADAIGPDNVEAVLMPSRYTGQVSMDAAIEQAKMLGVPYSIISIEPIFEAFLNQLTTEFEGFDSDVTEENIQARCRGTLLMAISNKKKKILITTGNKSEMAVGYATLYGDMAGGFAPIKDVPKMLVYELARYRNEHIGHVIPEIVFERAPTAELAENQRDTDSLPDYALLDAILQQYIEQEQDSDQIAKSGFEAETVRRIVGMVKRNEYKRRQAPPGVRITELAFGRDRRYPITNRS
ncbi:MAG: NAD+ synthase [Acidiferrobacterales bacterium]|nr:NAD+ synthase [Acidiferrobacterales bacterium]